MRWIKNGLFASDLSIDAENKAAMVWRLTMAAQNGDKGPERGIRPLSKFEAAGDKPVIKPAARSNAGDSEL
jgi:hypothetical protein